MSRVFIVRHGNTFASDDTPRRIGRNTDLDLTATGILQGTALGTLFMQGAIRFGRALSGPLRRTRQTAAMILRHQPAIANPTIATWLNEIDHGPDEGATEQDVVARIGVAALRDWDTLGIPPPGWLVEPRAMIEAWRTFLDTVDDEDVLVVTSNGVARFALLALPRSERPPSLRLRTGAFGVIERTAGGAETLPQWDERP